MQSLLKYTSLKDLWKIFKNVILVSATDANGYFTLSMLETYLKFNDTEVDATYEEFWDSMVYFLNRLNNDISQKRKKRKDSKK